MNILVLCTGRCGSLTFIRACGHIDNYSAGHETRCGRVGADRLAYPDNHIEADNRLAWLLGRLDETWGDRAAYVHLTRDPEATAQSWARRFEVAGGMASAYRDAILRNGAHIRHSLARIDSTRDYVATVTANISLFLKDKSRKMDFRVEHAAEDFATFWAWIGAEGAYDAATAEWARRHNPGAALRDPRIRLQHAMRRTLRAAFPPH
jgi:hypothetical protein